MDRPLCSHCKKHFTAINYKKNGKTYYRKKCIHCLRKKPVVAIKVSPWKQSGYKKKMQCDKCGFKSKISEQMTVTYSDGNPNNFVWTNLKTVCLNCNAELQYLGHHWKSSDLVPDF